MRIDVADDFYVKLLDVADLTEDDGLYIAGGGSAVPADNISRFLIDDTTTHSSRRRPARSTTCGSTPAR